MKRPILILAVLITMDLDMRASTPLPIAVVMGQVDSLESMVRKYYRLNVKVMQKGSSKKDIDRIFELFTDDFVYSHPKYGGDYSRQLLYKGYENNLAKGSYDGSIVDIRVEKLIVGLDAVAVSRTLVRRDGGISDQQHAQLTFFEFKDGKISHITEYW